MCMDSYKYMFNNCRIPVKPSDVEESYDPVKNTHIAVIRNNKFYIIDTVHNGKQLSTAELEAQFDRVMGYIDRATEPISLGGKLWAPEGYYVAPTIYTNVSDESALATEEIFGPVLAVLDPFDDVADAIRRVNASPYGLACGIFSQDTSVAQRMARSIQTGIVWINTYNYLPMRAPFGGAKMSGIGKDLGREAMDEFTFVKTIMTPV